MLCGFIGCSESKNAIREQIQKNLVFLHQQFYKIKVWKRLKQKNI
jgi:hypothetical protein